MKEIWKNHQNASLDGSSAIPSDADMFQCVELVLSSDETKVIERKRYPGENTIAMVAWKMTMRTPECPQGRDVIDIANDITIGIGSFGPKEDLLFLRASELSRKLR